MRLETDLKFTRPGVMLLLTGIASLLLRLVIGNVPAVGGLLSGVLLIAGLFFVAGGVFLLIKKGN